MSAVKNQYVWTAAFERIFVILGYFIYGSYNRNFGFFPFENINDEIHHFFSLITVSFSERHSFGTSRFNCGISYFYNKISHYWGMFSTKRTKIQKIIYNRSRLRSALERESTFLAFILSFPSFWTNTKSVFPSFIFSSIDPKVSDL